MKSDPTSVSIGIFAVHVILVQRLQLTSRGVAATKVVLSNCVNIKSKPRRLAGTRNRQGVDLAPKGSQSVLGMESADFYPQGLAAASEGLGLEAPECCALSKF